MNMYIGINWYIYKQVNNRRNKIVFVDKQVEKRGKKNVHIMSFWWEKKWMMDIIFYSTVNNCSLITGKIKIVIWWICYNYGFFFTNAQFVGSYYHHYFPLKIRWFGLSVRMTWDFQPKIIIPSIHAKWKLLLQQEDFPGSTMSVFIFNLYL